MKFKAEQLKLIEHAVTVTEDSKLKFYSYDDLPLITGILRKVVAAQRVEGGKNKPKKLQWVDADIKFNAEETKFVKESITGRKWYGHEGLMVLPTMKVFNGK